jgi:hypothetical protein
VRGTRTPREQGTAEAQSSPEREALVPIREDGEHLAPGQLGRSGFLELLDQSLRRMMEAELRGTGLSAVTCPWIPHYLERARRLPVHRLRRALALYVGPSAMATDAAGWVGLVTERARVGVREWRRGLMPSVRPLPRRVEAMLDDFGLELPAMGSLVPGLPPLPGSAGGRPSDFFTQLARLGEGALLDGGRRDRFESSLGVPLGHVRIHTGAEAGALAASQGARAVSFGPHVMLGAGAPRAGTVGYELMLAHELAHVAQSREGSASGPALERDADRAAVQMVLGGRASTAAGGLALRRCGSDPDMPDHASVDWEAAARETIDRVTARIREIHLELAGYSGASGPMVVPPGRLEELDTELRGLLAELRGVGVRQDDPNVVADVVAGTSLMRFELSLVDLDASTGGLYAGQRRRFGVRMPFRPTAVDIRYHWSGLAGTVLFGWRRNEAAEEVQLDDDFWRSWAQARARRSDDPVLTLSTTMMVGAETTARATASTPAMPVSSEPPDQVVVTSPQIFTLTSDERVDVTPGDQTPGVADRSGEPRFALTAPRAGYDLVPVDTDVEFGLDWSPPLGWTAGDEGWDVAWHMAPASQFVSPQELEDARGTMYLYGGRGFGTWLNATYEFDSPGEYMVYAVCTPVTLSRRFGMLPQRDDVPVLYAARRVQAVALQDMAARVLDRQIAQEEQRTFAEAVRAIDSSIASVEAQLAGGSPVPEQLRNRLRALHAQRERLRDEVGDPADLVPAPPTDAEIEAGTGPFVMPLPAAFAHPDFGGAQPLSTWIRLSRHGQHWDARVIDATTTDTESHLGWGNTPRAAAEAAIAAWDSGNDLPRGGQVAWRLDRWGLHDHFSTDSALKTVLDWAEKITAGVGIVVGLLLLMLPTGATQVAGVALLQAIGIGLLVAGIALGTYRIANNLRLGRPLLSEANVLEAVGIVAGLVGLRGGTLMRSAGRTLRAGAATEGTIAQIRVGERLIAFSTAMDAGSFVYVAGSGLRQLRQALDDPSLDDEARSRMLTRMMFQLGVQGLLTVGGVRDLVRPRTADQDPGLLARLVEDGQRVDLDPITTARIQIELRGRGLAPSELPRDSTALVSLLLTTGLDPRGRAVGGVYGVDTYPVRPGLDHPGGTGTTDAALRQQMLDERTELGSWLRTGRASARVRDATFARSRTTTSGSFGTGTITIPTGPPPGPPVTIAIEFKRFGSPVGPAVAPPAGPHGARSGPGRLELRHNGTGYEAVAWSDARISVEDAQHVLIHEMDEAVETVARYQALDPATRPPFADFVATQQQSVLFNVGSIATDPALATAHDVSAARELRGLHDRLQGPGGREFAGDPHRNAPHDATVQAWERDRDRLDRLLEDMGFDGTTTDAARTGAVANLLGLATPQDAAFRRFLQEYPARRRARMTATTYLAGARPGHLAGTTTRPELVGLVDARTFQHLQAVEARSPSDFEAMGLAGGHDDTAVTTFAAREGYVLLDRPGSPRVVDGMTVHDYSQFMPEPGFIGPLLPPASPNPPPPSGWLRATPRKTTVSDVPHLAGLADRAVHQNWDAGQNLTALGAGQYVFSGTLPGAQGPALVATVASGSVPVAVVIHVTVDGSGTRSVRMISTWPE